MVLCTQCILDAKYDSKKYHGVKGQISSFVSDTQNILTIFYENRLHMTLLMTL